MASEKPRFGITSAIIIDTEVFHIVDQLVAADRDEHLFVTAFTRADAELVAAKLNGPHNQTNPRLRPLAALEVCDFRLKLEFENGGPLTDDPQLAFFLDDLCTFLGFNTGERALALGAPLLVYLSTLEFAPPDAIQVVNSYCSSIVTEQYLTRQTSEGGR
jgi:hypothetical protein